MHVPHAPHAQPVPRCTVQEFYELERSGLLAANAQLHREAADAKARYARMGESYAKACAGYSEAAERCTAAEEELHKTKAEVGEGRERGVEPTGTWFLLVMLLTP